MQIWTTKAQRHQEILRSSSPQISQKDADFEIQIGEIGVICGSLLPFLVSLRHGGGFKATCLCGEKSAWDLPTHHFEVDGLLRHSRWWGRVLDESWRLARKLKSAAYLTNKWVYHRLVSLTGLDIRVAQSSG